MNPRLDSVQRQRPSVHWSDKSKQSKKGRKAAQLVFEAGEAVPQSGIYQVFHDQNHRSSHEAILRREDIFPDCEQCHEKVAFKILHTAPYIFDDEDFQEE